MDFLETNPKYDLNHNIYLLTHEGKIKLTADEALNVAYALVDSYGLDYKILDRLQYEYDKDKGEY